MKRFLASLLLLLSAGSVFAQVREEWVARYRSPNGIGGAAFAAALDAAGNVHVTGPSEGVGTSFDFATVKYDSKGAALWVARYNGPGNGYDGSWAIALDAAGNVYVTGSSLGAGTNLDYATVKYDSEGNELWVARYNGPGNGEDRAFAIALDAAGSAYVTGRSQRMDVGSDYATVKYDADGNELWVVRYHGPVSFGGDGASAIAVDTAGNAYVTGGSGLGDTSDYATVKYDPDGNQLWVARYNGPGNGYDGATALALDAAGNVHVTGASLGTGTSFDYATVKYDPDGNQLWLARYNGPENGEDVPSAIAVDAAGNAHVTGTSLTPDRSAEHYATVKYDFDGNELWVARYSGPGIRTNAASAIALDAAGNVYVTGVSEGAGTSLDYATLKYDPDGNQLWVARYDDPDHGDDIAIAIVLDTAGNVFVTGGNCNGPPDPIKGCASLDFATIKYAQ